MGVSDLVLDEVTDDDAGLYTCVVASLLGMTQQSAWLTVLPVVSEYISRDSLLQTFSVLLINYLIHGPCYEGTTPSRYEFI